MLHRTQKQPCACPRVYAPVTATNGKTYGNSCEARCDGAVVEQMKPRGSGNWKDLLFHLGQKGIVPDAQLDGVRTNIDNLTRQGLKRVQGFAPKKAVIQQAIGQINPLAVAQGQAPNNALIQRIQALTNPAELRTLVNELTTAYHQAAQGQNRFDPIVAGGFLDLFFSGMGKPRGSSRNSGFIQRMLAENNQYHDGEYKRPFKNSKDSTMKKNVVFNYDKVETPSDWIVNTFGKKSKKRDKPVSAGKTLETAIRELKARNPTMSQRALAKELGTSAATVNRVLKG
jgi:hypothetical protein